MLVTTGSPKRSTRNQTMSGNDVVILDRSWTPRLALGKTSVPCELREWLLRAKMIAVESGGASALINHLEDLNYTKDKLYLIRSNDFPKLSDESAQSLRTRIAAIGKTQPVISALRTYRVESGRMSDTDERVLGYVFRLMLLCVSLNGALLLWGSRYRMLREILSVSEIEFREENHGCLISLFTEETHFPFDDTGVIPPRRIRATAVNDNASSTNSTPADRVTAADLDKDELPSINVGIGGPSIDLIAWGRYLKKKLRRNKPRTPPTPNGE